MSPNTEICDALERLARERSAHPAVIDAAGPFTFADLWRAATRRAARRGPHRGTLVALSALSTRRLFIEVAATWLADGIPLPVDPNLSRAEIRAITGATEAVEHRCDPWKATVRVVDGNYRLLVTGGEPPTRPRKAHALGLGNAEPALFASPLHFNGPFEFALRHLLGGGTVVTLNRFDPTRWAATATATRASWAFLAPIQLARLLRDLPRDALIESTAELRTLLTSSAPCPPQIRDAFADLLEGHRFAELYGTAEYDGTVRRAHDTVSGALPMTGAALRIVDPAGTPLPPGAVGTIQGRSLAGLTGHYAGEDCAAATDWRGVGDQGFLDEVGRLHVTDVDVPGRAIVGGVKVALGRVASVLRAHPDVATCQVRTVPDDEYGQVVDAQVTVHPGASVNSDALADHCARHLCPAERPRHLQLLSDAAINSNPPSTLRIPTRTGR